MLKYLVRALAKKKEKRTFCLKDALKIVEASSAPCKGSMETHSPHSLSFS